MANKALFSTTTGGAIKDTDVGAYKEDGASGDPTRNQFFSVFKTYFQGLLPGRITQNETDVLDLQGLKVGTTQANPRSFTSGRFDSQELVSGTLSVSGWYTIAESEDISANRAGGTFRVSHDAGSLTFLAGFREATSVKNHQNTKIEIIENSFWGSINNNVGGIRLAKSDSVNGSGTKIQVFIKTNTSPILQIFGSNGNNAGFVLVTPYLDNTPTLPDGVTAGTFLEAGEELQYGGPATWNYPGFAVRKESSNDQLRCSVLWPEIPKQGTSITLTVATSIAFKDLDNNVSPSLASYTISTFSITGKYINFIINQTGIATGLSNNTPCFIQANGNLTLTIT